MNEPPGPFRALSSVTLGAACRVLCIGSPDRGTRPRGRCGIGPRALGYLNDIAVMLTPTFASTPSSLNMRYLPKTPLKLYQYERFIAVKAAALGGGDLGESPVRGVVRPPPRYR